MTIKDLEKYGITGTTELVYNPTFEQLFEAEMDPLWRAMRRVS